MSLFNYELAMEIMRFANKVERFYFFISFIILFIPRRLLWIFEVMGWLSPGHNGFIALCPFQDFKSVPKTQALQLIMLYKILLRHAYPPTSVISISL
jgi:hypothetical protein